MTARLSSLLVAVALQAPAQQPAATTLPSATSATVASAQTPVTGDSVLEARTSAVAASLRCPVCQGLSIQDSPSELAQQMRSLVHDQLAAGRSEAEVRSYFISKYGEWILLSPRPNGFNLLVYLLPAMLLVGGVGLIALVVRRWTSAAPATPGHGGAADSPAGD